MEIVDERPEKIVISNEKPARHFFRQSKNTLDILTEYSRNVEFVTNMLKSEKVCEMEGPELCQFSP